MKKSSWSPSSADYLEALADQNPWHALGAVPATLAKDRLRPLAAGLWRALLADQPRRFQIVLGPRRVGKTVTIHQTIQKLIEQGIEPRRLWYLSMDHPLLMNYDLGAWVKAITRRFSASNERPFYVFFDEINYASKWDLWLKRMYDEQHPIRAVATSSATAALKSRTMESGIGRWEEQYLLPYSFGEYLELAGRPAWTPATDDLLQTIAGVMASTPDPQFAGDRRRYLLVGGFPELLQSLPGGEDDTSVLLRSQQTLRQQAVQRVAAQDIPQAFDIKDPITLERLLYLLAGQVCGMVNVAKLGQSLEISRTTVHNYISYLERAYLLFMLPNYARTEEGVQRKRRKVFFVDGAVRNAALQRGLAPLDDSIEKGLLVENSVASHLFSLAAVTDVRLYYWRDGKYEVDFVYDHPTHPLAFEVTAGPHKRSRDGMEEFLRQHPRFRGRTFVVSASSAAAFLPGAASAIGQVPLDLLLVAVSSQARDAMARRLGVGL